MALSNQSELLAFSSPQQVISDRLLKMAKSRKMTNLPRRAIPEDDLPYQEWPNPGRWLTEMAKSRLTTSRNLKRGFDE